MSWLPRAPAAVACALVAAVACAGCGGDPSGADLVIRFEDDALRAVTVVLNVRIVRGGCDGSEVVYQEDVPVGGGEAGSQPPELAAGSYGFEVEARDSDCNIVARKCDSVTLPIDGSRIVVSLDVGTGAGSACGASETCISGRCRPEIPPDAGPDTGPVPCETEGAACGDGTTGTCHGGACCFGCWDGSACQGGDVAASCGFGGEACDTCVPGSVCRQGVCDVDPPGFYLTPVGTFLVERTGGVLQTAGDNTHAQRGQDAAAMVADTLTALPGTLRFADVAGSQFTTCGVTTPEGHLYCWGRNVLGALGVGMSTDMTTPAPMRVQMFGDEVYQQVTGGNGHFCALRSTGAIECWGDNRKGQLGAGSAATSLSRPTEVAGGGRWMTLAPGVGEHSCAIRADGTLWCWGANWTCDMGGACVGGQLAQPESMALSREPVQVGGNSDWTHVAAGVIHSCGIRQGGTLWCWGAISEDMTGATQPNGGQLGLGTRDGTSTPTQVGTRTGWRFVAGGEDHSCGLLQIASEVTAFCWGFGAWGQLGTGSPDDATMPTMVAGSAGFTQIATGWTHSCGVRGSAYLCWGDNRSAQLGDGTRDLRNLPTVTVPE